MKLPAFFSKITHSQRFSSQKLTYAWYRHYKIGFAFVFFFILLWGAYIWYFNIYLYQWDEAQKKEYLTVYFKETALKEKEFHALVQSLKNRALENQKSPEAPRNLFDGKVQ